MALPDSERIAQMELVGIRMAQLSTNEGPQNQKVPWTLNQDLLPRTYNIGATVVADSGLSIPGAPSGQAGWAFMHMLGML